MDLKRLREPKIFIEQSFETVTDLQPLDLCGLEKLKRLTLSQDERCGRGLYLCYINKLVDNEEGMFSVVPFPKGQVCFQPGFFGKLTVCRRFGCFSIFHVPAYESPVIWVEAYRFVISQ